MGYLGGNAVTVVDMWTKVQSQTDVGNSRIVRLTHVKNLDSSLAHEYLQIIMITPKGRERVIVERTDPDQFVFNGQWKKPGGFFGSGIGLPDPFNLAKSDLPLPLYSLQWDEQNAPTFYQLAQICKSIHDQFPEYDLLRQKHCYWYALAVYQAMKLAYGGSEKQWPAYGVRGYPTFMLSYGSTQSNILKGQAAQFQTERAKNMDWQVGSGPNVVEETRKAVESVVPKLANQESQQEYLQEMQAPEESVPTSIIDGLDIPTTPCKEPSAPTGETPDLSSFTGEYKSLEKIMNNDSTASENVAIFRDARNERANEGRDPSEPKLMITDDDAFGFSSVVEDSIGLNWAMEAFIGKVLKDIGVTPGVRA